MIKATSAISNVTDSEQQNWQPYVTNSCAVANKTSVLSTTPRARALKHLDPWASYLSDIVCGRLHLTSWNGRKLLV